MVRGQSMVKYNEKITKVKSIIIIFFTIIVVVIVGRFMMGMYFQKKFSKRPPPGIIVTQVVNYQFSEKVESFGTAIPNKTKSLELKENLIKDLELKDYVKKGDVIAELIDGKLFAPFEGVLGKRGLSEDVLDSVNSIIITLDDSSIIFSDIKNTRKVCSIYKKNLPVSAKFSGNKNKIYQGLVKDVSSRINADTRSLLIRVKIDNPSFELIPGSLLEVVVNFNQRLSLAIPDTSVILEGNKIYVYKVSDENIAQKTEINIGIRNNGNIEIISGLNEGDLVVAEGLKKVRANSKIKPIIK